MGRSGRRRGLCSSATRSGSSSWSASRCCFSPAGSTELLAEARAALGAYVGADPDDLVFVPNASAGVNVAAWPLGLEQGDEVLSTDLEYGALDLMWEHVCGDFGARYVRTPIRLPVTSGTRSSRRSGPASGRGPGRSS